MDPSTRVVRPIREADPTYGGLVPPIYPSTTYRRAADGSYPGGHSYSRDQNPTTEPAEQMLAALEEGAEALVFSSGMAAATALLDSCAAGTRVVAPRHMYWTIRRWFEGEVARGRLGGLILVDATNPDAWREAFDDGVGAGAPLLAWLETPANPTGDITDLLAVSELAHEAGAVVVADNTVATPVHTRPIEFGVDVVFHSATKQLNGHGDVLAGALVCAAPDALWERVRHERGYRGAVLGPFEAWLLARGMRTLFLRVRQSSAAAHHIAERLVDHPAVRAVMYPGLTHHPHHDVAARQMHDGFGMLVSIRLRGGPDAARRVLGRLELFTDATSLGSVESLAEHRSMVEGAGTPVPDDLLRLSIGIEHAPDLLTDLRHALDPER